MTFTARRLARSLSNRVLIVAVVPILSLILANLGRAGAAARDVTVRPKSGPPSPVRAPAEPLAPSEPTLPVREPLAIIRNPFVFAPRSLPPAIVPSPVSIAPPDIPSSVALSLIGVATTTRADGRAERTAIIAGPVDALYMVREADAVPPRFRVDAVQPDSVLLVDGTGASLRLVLR